jgi:hypothetical protein
VHTLARSVPCGSCGYDLRGLRTDGRCPECGFPIWETVRRAIDPRARRLPSISNPRRVGDALFAIVACLLVATLLLLAPGVARGLEGLTSMAIRARVPSWLPIAAGAVAILAVWPVYRLSPRTGAEPGDLTRRDLRLLAASLVAIGLLFAAQGVPSPWSTSPGRHVLHLLTAAVAVVVLIALRRVVFIVGERSRQFRTAKAGRQSVPELIAAVVGIAAGKLILLAPVTGLLVPRIRAVGSILIVASTLMLVIGLVYLLVNVSWIRRALRRPIPSLRDLLEQ